MKISKTDFRLIVDPSIMVSAGMPRIMQVLERIRFFYCMPKTTAGTCPAVCLQCKNTLIEVISNVDPARANSPYAVLVWRLRNAASKSIEKRSEVKKAKVSRNVFGEKTEIDPLDAMLAEL